MDDGAKNGDDPTTSKKEEARDKKNHLRDDDGEGSYWSGSTSSRPDKAMDTAFHCCGTRREIRLETRPPNEGQPQVSSKPSKPVARRKPARRGRVAKRRRSNRREYAPRRGHQDRQRRRPKAVRMRRARPHSAATVFSRMSSLTAANICKYCGHQCCGRKRFLRQKLRSERKRWVQWIIDAIREMRVQPKQCRCVARASIKSAGVQHGPPDQMLSKLCTGTNAMEMDDDAPEPPDNPFYMRVSPEMIYDALHRLGPEFPRDHVPYSRLLEFIMNTWSVTQDSAELNKELDTKLTVAYQIGMVETDTLNNEPHWRLCDDLLRRSDEGLTRNHVTNFWILYGDTMKPDIKDKRQEIDATKAFLAPLDRFTGHKLCGRPKTPSGPGPCCSRYV